jgi:hypothetical protein
MVLASKAWRLREEARTAVALGQFERCYQLAARAQEAKQTPAGESLRTLCEWLGATTVV